MADKQFSTFREDAQLKLSMPPVSWVAEERKRQNSFVATLFGLESNKAERVSWVPLPKLTWWIVFLCMLYKTATQVATVGAFVGSGVSLAGAGPLGPLVTTALDGFGPGVSSLLASAGECVATGGVARALSGIASAAVGGSPTSSSPFGLKLSFDETKSHGRALTMFCLSALDGTELCTSVPCISSMMKWCILAFNLPTLLASLSLHSSLPNRSPYGSIQ